MAFTRRVFVSMPAEPHLSDAQNAFKWAVVKRLEQAGLFAEIFFNPHSTDGLAASTTWTPDRLEFVLRNCVGAVLIGLPRWCLEHKGAKALMPSELHQYEGALARTLGLPLLTLVQEDVAKRGVFDMGFGTFIAVFPGDHTAGAWLESSMFSIALNKWKARIDDRRDIFIGYCSSSDALAENIKSFVTSAGATVLDWRTDFSLGRSVLDEITEASRRCSAGIFLFTRDDALSDGSASIDKAVPRDNVVFEAGYFMSLKGAKRVLIVRENGAKMPADLGGQIYTTVPDRSDITPIKNDLARFLAQLSSPRFPQEGF